MYGRKIEIGINYKYVKKNNSPKSREENISKILNKKEIKSNKPLTKKFEFYINEKKSPSKTNIFDDKIIKNNIIKKSPKKINVKKRQNKFFKKKMKEREPSSINSNLNIYKIINSKEIKCNKMPQSSSITTDSMNSYISNASNKINNNKCISLFQKTDNYNTYKRKRLDSDISNNSNNKNNLFINKDCSKIDNKNKYINKSNKKKIKDSNQNIRINILSPKCNRNINLSNNQMNNNISDLSNNEYKTDIKIRGFHNNMKENKSEFNIIFNKNNNIKDNNNKFNNIKKYSIYSKANNNKNINKEKCNDKKDDENNFNKKNNNYDYKEKIKTNKNNEINNENDENFVNIDEKININNNIDNLNQGTYLFNLNNFNNKKKLNPVKKSLFSEHMNFLINHQEENNIDHNNKINKKNFINIPFNSILDSTDKKDYESKFINYDLGKTTGTSSSKDSFLVFGNKKISEKNDLTKSFKNNKNNYCINEQEKEKTQEEIEKLAKEYINMSKNWENKDDYYKQNIIQTNTITTIIDNNYNEESINI